MHIAVEKEKQQNCIQLTNSFSVILSSLVVKYKLNDIYHTDVSSSCSSFSVFCGF